VTKTTHQIYIGTLCGIVILTTTYLAYAGFEYYNADIEERFYHSDHSWLKPSGVMGHGLGIFGTLIIIFGVSSYMIRKRKRALGRFGLLKHWLEFHIFCCTIGPIMILFHTSFKFGGMVSISFWSMVAVVLSGVIGRFIYIQIPRTIEGRQLSLSEVKEMKSSIGNHVKKQSPSLDDQAYKIIEASVKSDPRIIEGNIVSRSYQRWKRDSEKLKDVKHALKKGKMAPKERKQVLKLVRQEITLNHRISRLDTLHKIFKYWHVAHLPFAVIMLLIMIIHVAVTLLFGYKWIF